MSTAKSDCPNIVKQHSQRHINIELLQRMNQDRAQGKSVEIQIENATLPKLLKEVKT